MLEETIQEEKPTKELVQINCQFIPIIVRYSLDEVYVITALLNNYDIKCLIPDECILSVYPLYGITIGGVKVWVDRNDFDTAKEILINSEYTSENDIDLLQSKYNHIYELGEVYFSFRIKEIKIRAIKFPKNLYKFYSTDFWDLIKRIRIKRQKLRSNYLLKCPHCNSENVYKPKISRKILVLTYLATSIPIPVKTRKVFCFDCNNIFNHKKGISTH